METLKNQGFTHCFYVAGGNSMHLLESASHHFICIPVVHEVTAAIAAEYFNESGNAKAFALATAGPGLTNMVTGIAGAWLESHELLVVGGQVKSENLMKGGIRQGGIQEIDGITLLSSITKKALRIENPIPAPAIIEIIEQGRAPRKGPVFIEICLDASAADVDFQPNVSSKISEIHESEKYQKMDLAIVEELTKLISKSTRPLILLGNGITREASRILLEKLEALSIPVATTWSGADRCGFQYKYYAGRPNNFGMRWANIFQQQADLLIVIGSSLGFQQSGFNVGEFLPTGTLVHVDIDKSELEKINPGERMKIQAESGVFADALPKMLSENLQDISEWLMLLAEIKITLPILEDVQTSQSPYVSPHQVINRVSRLITAKNPAVICSSGGTFTAGMQCFENQTNQILLANKGLASMGYGMAGAIGVAFQNAGANTMLFEGDGGFAQNLQDLGTISANKLPIKMFITNNRGYASIRTTQKNYFNGNYLGCDIETGLGFPDWRLIAASFGIRHHLVDAESILSIEFENLLQGPEPILFEVNSDPEQIYFPKVSSVINSDGSMVSTAIHDMLPKLSPEVGTKVFKFLPVPE